MRRMIARDVNVTFPKFKMQSNEEMTDILKQVFTSIIAKFFE